MGDNRNNNNNSSSTATKPGWMKMPGGPPEPKFDVFIAKVQKLNADKSALFDKVKALSEQLGGGGGGGGNGGDDVERRALQERLSHLRGMRNAEDKGRQGTRDKIQEIRNRKHKVEAQLQALSQELGAFQTLADIDTAIDFIMIKMETGGAGGSLKAEKKTADRLVKLEKAKSLLLNLQPLQDAVEEADDREGELADELRDISERMKQLNKDMGVTLEEKKVIDEKNKSGYEARQALVVKRSAISDQITAVFAEITATRATFDDARKAWDEWKVVAQEQYQAKMEAERAERQKLYKEREESRRNERKKHKIAARRNPHAREIEACQTLVLYLKDKKEMTARADEDRRRRAETANFNPVVTAPVGMSLLQPKGEAVCIGDPKKKNKNKKKAATAVAVASTNTNNNTNNNNNNNRTVINHAPDKHALFDRVAVDAPVLFDNFDATIATLKKKQEEFESHIQRGQVDVSSSEEEEEEAVVAEAAPAKDKSVKMVVPAEANDRDHEHDDGDGKDKAAAAAADVVVADAKVAEEEVPEQQPQQPPPPAAAAAAQEGSQGDSNNKNTDNNNNSKAEAE